MSEERRRVLMASANGGGGKTIVGGEFTLPSNNKTFSVTVPENITNFVFYATDYDEGISGASWHVVGGVWFNNVGMTLIRYNNNNRNYSQLDVELNGTTLTGTAYYNLRTEKTYKWYAW